MTETVTETKPDTTGTTGPLRRHVVPRMPPHGHLAVDVVLVVAPTHRAAEHLIRAWPQRAHAELMRPCVTPDSSRGLDPATTRYVTAHTEAWTSETVRAHHEIRARGIVPLADTRPQGPQPVTVREKLPCRSCVDQGEHGMRCHRAPEFHEHRLVPSRPLGASWCGAQDMAGNVWEWTDRFDSRGGGVLGGSFRSELGPRWPTEIDQRGYGSGRLNVITKRRHARGLRTMITTQLPLECSAGKCGARCVRCRYGERVWSRAQRVEVSGPDLRATG